MTKPLTPRQLSVLLHIRGQLLMTSRPPTVRKLTILLGLSPSSVYYVVQTLQRLERMGWIKRGPRYASRNIQLLSACGMIPPSGTRKP